MSRAAPAPPDPSPPDPSPPVVHYPVKWVLDCADKSLPICMQGRNGPCALLSLFNSTLQSRELSLQPGTTRVREDHLMALLADYVSTRPSSGSDPADKLREHAVADFLDLLPNLSRGMHVNVRFNTPTAFEFTRELAAFDVFPAVRLLHGWLVDPQDVRLAEVLGTLSYNQVIDELVRTTPVTPPEPPEELEPAYDALVHTPSAPPIEAFDLFAHPHPDDRSDELDSGPVAQESPPPVEETRHTREIRELRPAVMDFLESNPTQLTVYGLTELHAAVSEGERAILFRNSHFYVVQKHAGELFTLVTDVGYLNELNTVWEKLSDINGDSTFYNGKFQRLSPTGEVVDVAGSANPVAGSAPQKKQPPTMGRRPSHPEPRPNSSNSPTNNVAQPWVPQQPPQPWVPPQPPHILPVPPIPHVPYVPQQLPGQAEAPGRGQRPGRRGSEKCIVQ